MRVVGHTQIATPNLVPSAAGLLAARAHQQTGLALAAMPTTGIRKGVYRFASHEDMNRASEAALIRAVGMNALARKALPDH